MFTINDLTNLYNKILDGEATEEDKRDFEQGCSMIAMDPEKLKRLVEEKRKQKNKTIE